MIEQKRRKIVNRNLNLITVKDFLSMDKELAEDEFKWGRKLFSNSKKNHRTIEDFNKKSTFNLRCIGEKSYSKESFVECTENDEGRGFSFTLIFQNQRIFAIDLKLDDKEHINHVGYQSRLKEKDYYYRIYGSHVHIFVDEEFNGDKLYDGFAFKLNLNKGFIVLYNDLIKRNIDICDNDYFKNLRCYWQLFCYLANIDCSNIHFITPEDNKDLLF